MSRQRFTLILDVDDEILAAHDGVHRTPPNDVADWEARDISDAVREGIVDMGESEATYEGAVDDNGDFVE